MADSMGLMESLKRLTGTLLAIFRTRLELLTNEMEAERLRVEQMLVYGGVALFFFGLAIMLLTVFIVVLFWDSQRLLVLGSLTVLFFVAGVVSWNTMRRISREKSRLFSSSLAELSEDHHQVVSES